MIRIAVTFGVLAVVFGLVFGGFYLFSPYDEPMVFAEGDDTVQGWCWYVFVKNNRQPYTPSPVDVIIVRWGYAAIVIVIVIGAIKRISEIELP